VPTIKPPSPYSTDAPCCGASAASGAFIVTQTWPCSAACRCCGTSFVEGTVIPGDNLDAEEVVRRVRNLAPGLSEREAFVEPWACRARLQIKVLGDQEFTSVSAFYADDAPARSLTPEGATR